MSSLRNALRFWSLLLSFVLAACTSVPRVSEYRFTEEYFSSRDSLLRYRLPLGWLNATSDSPSPNNIIWLVRSDFAVTLAVGEVVIDVETRREVNRTGLKRLAEVTLALASGDNGVNVVKPPALSSLRGTSVCTYEYLIGHPSDRIHVVLVDTGVRVYEVSALMTEKVNEDGVANIIAMQEAFVQNVLW
ncbi:MAG: hypothetical protein AAB393_03085 [Bacteroidota bacterium]